MSEGVEVCFVCDIANCKHIREAHALTESKTMTNPTTPTGASLRERIEQPARQHGTGGWQTLDDMVKFGMAVSAIEQAGTGQPAQAVDAKALLNKFAKACCYGSDEERIRYGDEILRAIQRTSSASAPADSAEKVCEWRHHVGMGWSPGCCNASFLAKGTFCQYCGNSVKIVEAGPADSATGERK